MSHDVFLEDVLSVVEESLKATTAQAMRESIVYGVGALMDSVSCVWTELDTNLFEAKAATTTALDINQPEIDVPEALTIFNQYAYQHPVIKYVMKTEDDGVFSMSDLLTRTEFRDLELYQKFYLDQDIEDQLSVGYVENGNIKGLSVNRASWGFSDEERNALKHIAHCVFPLYRLLQDKERNETGQAPLPLIVPNINAIMGHSDLLGITPREAELLTHVAQGKCNKQIADTCCISEGTVRKHLENAYRRLGVNNRISAIIKCMAKIQHANKA